MIVRVSLLWSGQTSSVRSGSTGHGSFTRSPDLWATSTAIGKLWSMLKIVWRGCLVARQLGNSLWGCCFHSIQWDFPDLRSAATAVLKFWAIETHVYIPLKFRILWYIRSCEPYMKLSGGLWSIFGLARYSSLGEATAVSEDRFSVHIGSWFPHTKSGLQWKSRLLKSATHAGVPVPKACPPCCLWLLWCGQQRVPSHSERK